jgi:hypothetical protein
LKPVRRGFLILVFVSVLGGLTWYFWPKAKTDAWKYIPSDAWYILTTDNLLEDWEDFIESEVWQVLKHHPDMEELSADVAFLDTLFMDNEPLLGLVNRSPICVSAHPVKGDYDFLYFVDLGKEQDASTVRKGLHLWAKNYGYRAKEATFFTRYADDEEEFYIGQVDQILVFTFHPELAAGFKGDLRDEESMDRWDLGPSEGFQLYIPSKNYKALTSYYLNEIPGALEGLDSLVDYLKLQFRFEHQMNAAKGKGYWLADAERPALLTYPKKAGDLGEVLPARTAWASRYNFEHVDSLYRYFVHGEASLQSMMEKTSKILDIEVYELLTSWVGNSITVAQLDYSINPNSTQDAVVLIEIKDFQDARTKIRMLEQAIQRRTPGKMRRIDYKGQVITYPGISGLFKPFLAGKMQEMTLPYYTFIGRYLALSSDPKTLAHIIEDRAEGNTCREVFDELELENKEGSVQLYFSATHLEGFIRSWFVNNENSNRTVQVLSKLGVGYLNVKAGKESLGLEFILKTDSSSGAMLQPNFSYETYVAEPQSEAIEWIDEGIYKKFYAGTNLVQIEAKTKEGLLHGKYTEYYRNGKIKATGKYKHGLKTGTWKYYSLNGELQKKEKK